jgi:hypothetical protein
VRLLAEVDVWRGEIAAGLRIGPAILRARPILPNFSTVRTPYGK